MKLQGKSVLITGGTGALGHVVAECFLKEGASVATSYLFEDELKHLKEEFRKNVVIIRADVTNDEDVVALFRQATKQFNKVDILVNLVGGFLAKSQIRDVKLKDWDHMMNINLKSTFLCSRQFLQNLGDLSYGRIISMAAMPALKPSGGRGPYAVAKGGVVMLTEILGEELKGTGVTANAIAPSILRTEANMASMPGEDTSKWVTPEAVADMMLHLCSPDGRAISGVTIPMFGGLS
ncbi:MAG TPA: SDR family NAD(P)-dependent oxidoreductase [Bacteroidota bacterium]|nr:SDR family NAD(P)-dependent oxidoreductase [Bacteroidota bacterium]